LVRSGDVGRQFSDVAEAFDRFGRGSRGVDTFLPEQEGRVRKMIGDLLADAIAVDPRQVESGTQLVCPPGNTRELRGRAGQGGDGEGSRPRRGFFTEPALPRPGAGSRIGADSAGPARPRPAARTTSPLPDPGWRAGRCASGRRANSAQRVDSARRVDSPRRETGVRASRLPRPSPSRWPSACRCAGFVRPRASRSGEDARLRAGRAWGYRSASVSRPRVPWSDPSHRQISKPERSRPRRAPTMARSTLVWLVVCPFRVSSSTRSSSDPC
jgi:hypothetical protein